MNNTATNSTFTSSTQLLYQLCCALSISTPGENLPFDLGALPSLLLTSSFLEILRTDCDQESPYAELVATDLMKDGSRKGVYGYDEGRIITLAIGNRGNLTGTDVPEALQQDGVLRASVLCQI